MRPAEAHGPPPTLYEVVHRGVEVADPSGQFGVADLLPPVEDADEPVTGHRDIEQDLAELKGRIDPQDEDPAVMMAIAVAMAVATLCEPAISAAPSSCASFSLCCGGKTWSTGRISREPLSHAWTRS